MRSNTMNILAPNLIIPISDEHDITVLRPSSDGYPNVITLGSRAVYKLDYIELPVIDANDTVLRFM